MSKHATTTLVQLVNASPEVVNGLLLLMSSEESYVRQRAEEALVRLGKTSDKILPEVGQWLDRNKDKNIMGRALDCLYSIVVQ